MSLENIQKEVQSLEQRLDELERHLVVTDNEGKPHLHPTVVKLLKAEFQDMHAGAGMTVTSKVNEMISQHKDAMNKARLVFFGGSLLAVVTACATIYKLVDDGRTLTIQKAESAEEKRERKSVEAINEMRRLVDQFLAETRRSEEKNRLKVDELQQAIETKVRNLAADFTTYTNKLSTQEQEFHETLREQRGSDRQMEILYRELSDELKRLTDSNQLEFDRFRLDLGTWVTLYDDEIDDFLGVHDAMQAWIEPGYGFDPARARYSLADGRNIVGSALHKERGISEALPPENQIVGPARPGPEGRRLMTLLKINP